MIENYTIFAVIPAFNEENYIKNVVEGTKKYVNKVIVVNDYSTDNTSTNARTTDAIVIDLPENKGAGYATRTGCEMAINQGADIIITLDADGQHCADDIPKLINELIEKKADLVFGFRTKGTNTPLKAKLGNVILSILHHALFNIKLQDALTGFHAFRATSFPKIKWNSDRYGFITEFVYIIHKNKLIYGEAPVKTIYLDKKSGMSIKDGIKSICLLIIWRFGLSKRLIKMFYLN